MKELKVRLSRPEDNQNIVEWLNATPENRYVPEILKYPTLQILCAYHDSGPVAYLPFHDVMMLESVAKKPGIDNLTAAQAFRDLTKAATLLATAKRQREIYFLDGALGMARMAARHNFEVLPWKALRMKVE